MMADFYMFGSGVKNRIFGKLDGGLVVAVDRDRNGLESGGQAMRMVGWNQRAGTWK